MNFRTQRLWHNKTEEDRKTYTMTKDKTMSLEYHRNVKVILNWGAPPWSQLMHLAHVLFALLQDSR